ncbi:MAG: beta-ketoacyl synthase N-terminal-like domain-containing protein [Chloroflexota bacterium]
MNNENKSKRVVITGLGAVTPVGNNVGDTWHNLIEGNSGIAPVTLFDPSDFGTRFGGEVKGFDGAAIFGRREARRMDRFTQFALSASHQAIADAGIADSNIDKTRVGTIIGSALGGMITLLKEHDVNNERGPKRVNPFFIPMILPDTPAAQLSIDYGIYGPFHVDHNGLCNRHQCHWRSF